MPSITTDLPLADAVAVLDRKTPVGAALSSREWERLPAEIRLRAMFSARVENERLLGEMQQRLQARIELAKKDGRTMDRGVFIEEMRAELTQSGYKRGDAKRGSLRDLKSTRRLGLIWDMNLAQVQGYAKWKSDMDPDILDAVPAQELIRVRAKVEVREWPLVWADHGGKFYGEPGPDYPNAPGRMIALKTDPIWRWISRFKTPWPPYDWGSGMGLRNVRRDAAETLGVLAPGAQLIPLAVPFNEGAEMSAKGVPESGRESLRSAFGDAIRFDGERILLQRHTSPETYEQRKQDITSSLRERARDIAERGRDHFRRFRSEDDAAAWPPGFETGEYDDEVLAHTAAVAVGRKLLYHDEWPGFAENFSGLIRNFLPPEVVVAVIDGHVYAFRPDIIGMEEAQIHALIKEGDMGRMLGYGQNMLDEPAALVKLAKEDGTGVSSFMAPQESAKVYARARAKDWSDALGWVTRIFISGKEVFP